MKRIAFITDVHLDEQFPIDNHIDARKNLDAVLSDIADRKISEVIFGGDIGEACAHGYFFKKLGHLSLNLILGNHDRFKEVKAHFIKDGDRDELYYKSEDENYQFIFVDSSADELSHTQLQWLKTALSEKKELMLFIHHPVLEIETPVDKAYPLKNRDALKSILLQFKNQVTIFCGHYHMNDEQRFENINQYTTQSLSYQMVKHADEIEVDHLNFGYRIIELDDRIISTQVVNFDQNAVK